MDKRDELINELKNSFQNGKQPLHIESSADGSQFVFVAIFFDSIDIRSMEQLAEIKRRNYGTMVFLTPKIYKGENFIKVTIMID